MTHSSNSFRTLGLGTLTITLLALVALLAVGCAQEAEEPPPAAVTEEVTGVDTPIDTGPIQVMSWLEDARFGSQANELGWVPDEFRRDEFLPGETVHFSARIGDDLPGDSAARVIWYNESGQDMQVGQEQATIPAGQQYFHTMTATDGWPVGDYRVEIWIGDEQAVDEDFDLRDELQDIDELEEAAEERPAA